jgi:hypothetical protein
MHLIFARAMFSSQFLNTWFSKKKIRIYFLFKEFIEVF